MFNRSVSLDRAKLDENERTIDVSVSSETSSVRRWFGAEILKHTSRSIDLDRIRSTGAVLFNHDADRIIGPAVDPRVEDKKLRVTVKFDDTDEGNLRMAQVKSGSLRGASLQYSYGPNDFVEVPEGRTRDGIEGPARIVTRWTPVEVTLTPVPADTSVGVGRSEKHTNRGVSMKFKWEAVVNGGETVKRFTTKSMAREWADEQDGEVEIRKFVEVEGDGSDETTRTTNDNTTVEVEIEKMRGKLTEEAFERFEQIITAGEIAGCREFAMELAKDKKTSVPDAQRQIHEKWLASERDKQKAPNVEPETNGKKRSLKDVDDDSFVENLSRSTVGWLEVGSDELSYQDWRSVVSSAGTDLQRKVNDMFKDGDLKPSQISFRALYDSLGSAPCKAFQRDEINGSKRAVMSTAFDVIAGSTVIAAVREGYENVKFVGDMLVDEYQSSSSIDTIPAILTELSMKEVQEGKPYLEGSASEEYHTVGSKKQGRILALTREMIQRDQTGLFLQRANRLGEKAQQAIEKLIFQRVTDGVSGEYVYYPSGTGTALYSTTARARGTNKVATNALVDTTDLDNARALLAGMTDNEGDPINAQPAVLVVPDALVGVASKILGSEMTPGLENEMNTWGPRGLWRPMLVTSPVLDTISTSSWYLGDPKRQFVMKRAFGIESTLRTDTDASLTHDILMKFRVAFDVEIGAIDYVYFVQSTAA